MPDLLAPSPQLDSDVCSAEAMHALWWSASSRLPVRVACRPASVVELIGPAGAGKTTLRRALAELEPQCRTAVRIDRRRELPVVMRAALRLLPLLAGATLRRRAPSWSDAVQLVRLSSLHPAVARAASSRARFVVLDEGPVFALAKLDAYSHAAQDAGAFGVLWRDALARWRDPLDLVVWLDAPDELLTRRIRARAKPHRVKTAGAIETEHLLSRYRDAYGAVVARLCTAGGPRLLRIDTSAGTTAEHAARLLAELRTLEGNADSRGSDASDSCGGD